MATEGDEHLRQQLDELRTAHYEQSIGARVTAFAKQLEEEQDASSTERAIVDGSKVLRDKIDKIQRKQLRRQRATRVSKWLLSRSSRPGVRFDFIDDQFGFAPGDFTVTTEPLMATKVETVDGTVSYGWVFRLQSPIPDAMVGFGALHEYGRYQSSPLEIFRVAEDETTGLQSKELWFTVNPDTEEIKSEKDLEKRREIFHQVFIEDPIPEEDRHVIQHTDEETGEVWLEFRKLSPESKAREAEREREYQERAQLFFASNQEDSLLLLGLINGAIIELS